ncbi:Uncharacterised protein [Mycobacteroides abscessus subsp. abscessus]|nr:Uncharacterised protein [Mycobacteroides abscessus subsp. abscessus]
MHQLRRALGRSTQACQLVDQIDRSLTVGRAGRYPRRRGPGLQRPVLPCRPIGGDEDVDIRPRRDRRLGEESGTFQL